MKKIKTVTAMARIISPEPEVKINDDFIQKWKTMPNGILKIQKLLELHKNGFLIDDQYFNSFKNMCLKGGLIFPEGVSNLGKVILNNDEKENAACWFNCCYTIVNSLRKKISEIEEVIKFSGEQTYFEFINDEKNPLYQFALLIENLGIASITKEIFAENKRECYLIDSPSYCDGKTIFKKILEEMNPVLVKEEIEPINDNIIPDKMIENIEKPVKIEINNYHGLIGQLKNNSDNRTKGDDSPIGKKNGSYKKTIKTKTLPENNKIFETILITFLIPFIIFIFSLIPLIIDGNSIWQSILIRLGKN